MDGELQINEPVRVYDCSGPWGDPEFDGDVEKGLPALRSTWVRARGDVEEYDGRSVKPQDNGYLSASHRSVDVGVNVEVRRSLGRWIGHLLLALC